MLTLRPNNQKIIILSILPIALLGLSSTTKEIETDTFVEEKSITIEAVEEEIRNESAAVSRRDSTGSSRPSASGVPGHEIRGHVPRNDRVPGLGGGVWCQGEFSGLPEPCPEHGWFDLTFADGMDSLGFISNASRLVWGG